MLHSFFVLITFLALSVANIVARESPYQQDILGDGFECKTIVLKDDYLGEARASLVRRLCPEPSSRSVFYLHGYNDYFFQTQMAQQFIDAGYNFYALDLRRYGRSWREGEPMFDIRTLESYFEEISKSLQIIREEGSESIVAMGHSTGGLTLSLFAKKNYRALPFKALILNSPFFDMNLGAFLEATIVPSAASVGSLFPALMLPMGGGSAYAQSLLRDYHGEWEYDTKLKSPSASKMSLGWLRAINLAHQEIQKGAQIPCPILLLYSSATVRGEKWTEAHQVSDSVLDVAEIKKYGEQLGPKVTSHEVQDGLHDLFLSKPAVRGSLYSYVFEWLDLLQN